MISNVKKKPSPSSCDTFVAVGLPYTSNDQSIKTITVFGKNSDRPNDETHEVVYFPRQTNSNEILKCQYLTIPQVPTTYSVVLSRPAWLWGCEWVPMNGDFVPEMKRYGQERKVNVMMVETDY